MCNNSSYDLSMNIIKTLQDNDIKNILIKFINKVTDLELKDIIFSGIERFKSIVEYDFYIINLVGIIGKNKTKNMFIKIIKKGKIKESLFCICDLAYEKYFNVYKAPKEKVIKSKKITIFEDESTKHFNKVVVNLVEPNLNKKKLNIEIYFIEISKILEQTNNIKKKGWEKYIDINPMDIIIVGVKNKY